MQNLIENVTQGSDIRRCEWIVNIADKIRGVQSEPVGSVARRQKFLEVFQELTTNESDTILQENQRLFQAAQKCFTRNFMILSEELRPEFDPFRARFWNETFLNE